MMLVGLTGILGSGKSTVANLLRKRGLYVIDLDQLAKDSLNWKETRQDIREAFGDHYVNGDKVNVDRLKMAAFADINAKRKLESIIHPRVEEKVKGILGDLERKGNNTAVIDHPLLFEVGFKTPIAKKVVVNADMKSVRERIKKRGMTADDMERRLSFQIPLEIKVKLADFVIDNNGTPDRLENQVDSLIEKITKWEEEYHASK
jgi:dephospho-CoA kinase